MQYNDNCCHACKPAWCFWLRLIVAAILAALLLRGCLSQPAATGVAATTVVATAATTTTPTATVASFTSAVTDGHITLTGSVKDQATKDAIVNAAKAQYGEANVVDQLIIDANATNPAVDMNKLFTWQKTAGTTSIAINDKTITLTGTVADQMTKDTQGKAASDLFGAGYTIDNQLQVAAVSNMAKDATCEETLKSTVEFATGSAQLTGKGKIELDNVATCLKDGHFEVAGHTDNTGNADANQKLSEARAVTVVNYLATKNVAADRMTAKGYGDTQAIASNDTAEGRQQNRRITFVSMP